MVEKFSTKRERLPQKLKHAKMYRSTTKCFKDKDLLYQAFKPEEHKDKRSELKVTQEKDHTNITIKAKDAVALRAISNSVTRLLSIYEKIKKKCQKKTKNRNQK